MAVKTITKAGVDSLNPLELELMGGLRDSLNPLDLELISSGQVRVAAAGRDQLPYTIFATALYEDAEEALIVIPLADGDTFPLEDGDPELAAAERLWRVRQVLESLRHLHSRGVVHGDIKPENVLQIGSGFAQQPDTVAFLSRGHTRYVGTVLSRQEDKLRVTYPRRGSTRERELELPAGPALVLLTDLGGAHAVGTKFDGPARFVATPEYGAPSLTPFYVDMFQKKQPRVHDRAGLPGFDLDYWALAITMIAWRYRALPFDREGETFTLASLEEFVAKVQYAAETPEWVLQILEPMERELRGRVEQDVGCWFCSSPPPLLSFQDQERELILELLRHGARARSTPLDFHKLLSLPVFQQGLPGAYVPTDAWLQDAWATYAHRFPALPEPAEGGEGSLAQDHNHSRVVAPAWGHTTAEADALDRGRESGASLLEGHGSRAARRA